MMTKQNFEFVAALIDASNKGVPAFGLQEIACGYFMNDNPRFDADRFRDACGNPLPPPPKEIEIVSWQKPLAGGPAVETESQ